MMMVMMIMTMMMIVIMVMNMTMLATIIRFNLVEGGVGCERLPGRLKCLKSIYILKEYLYIQNEIYLFRKAEMSEKHL